MPLVPVLVASIVFAIFVATLRLGGRPTTPIATVAPTAPRSSRPSVV